MTEQYLPLYRKYRPQEFGDLVGQDNLVKAFTNAINTGKIAHAYLFCGPRGTGKTSSARILAKSLNCQNGPTLTPCGKCPSCLDILNGNMIDVIEMDAASNRSVDDAQNIIDKIHYAPVNGKFKIFIIDEVHMISKQAFNALLKTLEEPPENVIFILATTEPQKVLETIISRCQRFDFRRITVDDIVKRLKFISEKENIKISDDALLLIAKNSQGGMRDALALLDQVSVIKNDSEITVDDINDTLGKIDTATLIELTNYIFEKSVDKAIQKINEIYAKGNEPLQIIENIIQYMRNLSVAKTCKDKNVVEQLTLLSKDYIDKLIQQKATIQEIAHIIDKLGYYHKEIKFTNNRYLWLELCFIDIASGTQNISATIQQIPPQIQTQPQINNVEKDINPIIEELQQPVAVQVQPPEAKKVEEPKNTETKKDKKTSADDWHEILNAIDSPPSKSFFSTFARPIETSKEKVTINFKDENFYKRANDLQKKLDALKTACLKFYNVASIEVEVKVGETFSKPKTENNAEPKPVEKIQPPKVDKTENQVEDIPNNIETSIQKDEKEYTDQVKMVKDLFDAKLFE